MMNLIVRTIVSISLLFFGIGIIKDLLGINVPRSGVFLVAVIVGLHFYYAAYMILLDTRLTNNRVNQVRRVLSGERRIWTKLIFAISVMNNIFFMGVVMMCMIMAYFSVNRMLSGELVAFGKLSFEAAVYGFSAYASVCNPLSYDDIGELIYRKR